MAGYPPPYGFDVKAQQRMVRDQIRAQARAQKAAIRAQRDMMRYQTRSLRRSSILAPIIIVIAGVVILLIQLGRLPFATFAAWYSHWWPALLVIAGLILVAEWAFDDLFHHGDAPIVRRGVGGGAIFLLILLAATGASIRGLEAGHNFFVNGFNIDDGDLNEFFGDKHVTTQPVDADFPAGTTLSIDNPHGDVTVIGKSDDNKVHIIVDKQVWSRSDSDADAQSNQLAPRVFLDGTTLHVILNNVNNGRANLNITVPEKGETTINANHGDVNVSAMKAAVTINANHGDIALDAIAGNVIARTSHSDSTVSAHTVTGDLSLRGHADDVSLTDISGQTSMEGEFYGDTHLERLRGPVSFRTSRTQFSLARLDGEVDISPRSDLTASQIVGPIDLKTRSRNITFERVLGDVNVTNSKGSVDVTSAAPLGNVTIDNRDGEVNVTVPDKAGLTVFAQSQGGEISNDLNLTTSSSNNLAIVQGTIGTGASHLTIHNTHLGIEIHKGFVMPPTPPPPPAAPAPPARPEKAVKPEKSEKPEKPEQPEKPEKPAAPTKPTIQA